MHTQHGGGLADLLIYALPMGLIVGYIVLVYRTNRKYKKWPVNRIVFWIFGVVSIFSGIMGPIAERAHASFQAHMMTHLLIGMLGPLLIVLSTPMSLLLRSVPLELGRFLSKLLKSFYVRWITHPFIAGVLNAGGLWILYTTGLYHAMHDSDLIYILVHIHVFLAGYVFTLSMIYIEITPHRTSFQLRAIILILAMAAHSILAKWIYANPPAGVETIDAQHGAMLMYYGGDAVDLILVILLCSQYFNGTKRTREERVYSIAKASEG